MTVTDVLLRSSAILVAGLPLDLALGRRSAAVRHFVLAIAIGASVAVIPLSLTLPSWDIPSPYRGGASVRVTSTTTVTTSSPRRSGADESSASDWPWMEIGWAGGFVLTASVLLIGVCRLSRISSRAER